MSNLLPNILRCRIPVLVCLGLMFANVFSDVAGHGTAFAASAQAVQVLTNGRVFFSIGLGLSGFCFLQFPKKASVHDAALLGLTCAMACLSVIAYLCAPNMVAEKSVVAGVLGALGIGFSYGTMLVRLLAMLAQVARMPLIVGVSVFALLGKTVLASAVGVAAGGVQAVAMLLCIPLSACCVVWARRDLRGESDVIDLAEHAKCDSGEARVLAAILYMHAILHALTRSLSTLGFWGATYSLAGMVNPVFLLAAAALSSITVLTLGREDNADIFSRFMPAFLTVLGGFFVLTPDVMGLIGIEGQAMASVTTVVELYAHTLYWVIIVTAIRSLPDHPYRIAGSTVAIMCVVAVAASLLIQNIADVSATVAMAAMYFFSIVIVFLMKGSRESGAVGGLDDGASADAQGARLTAMAQSFGLSPRETQVFMLLAQGRDRAFIKGELFISDATIKTHMQHIYTKMSIHSKQELISLVQAYGEDA